MEDYARIIWNWRAAGLYERAVPGPIRSAIARQLPRLPESLARYARRSFLADRSQEAMLFDSFGSVRLTEQMALVSPAGNAGDPTLWKPAKTMRS